jgi:hypothetical protein
VVTSILKGLAITSPTSGGRSVGIVRSQTQTMEFSFLEERMLMIVLYTIEQKKRFAVP